MWLGGAISNLRSLVAKLLPAANGSAQAPSSSSSPPVESHQIEGDLRRLAEMLERVKATLYDAEQREIRDLSVKLWLKELKQVAYDAEDVLGEYHYEILRAQVEARDASAPNPRKRKQVQMPDGMFDQISQIMARFDEICKDRERLRLSEEDGPRRCNSERKPTSHFIIESNIFGREVEKERLIDLLSSERHDGNVISVVTIIGTGGLGKTTLAQLVYKDKKIRERFDMFGWVCVSEDFNVQRLTRELVESITREKCDLSNLSALQDKIREVIIEKRVLLVLDDVWNEKLSPWESFQAPFLSATLVKILVTTRNEPVAQMMQTMPTFMLDYLSENQCWQLFQHYAFVEGNQNEGSELLEIGKQIMEKCGRLPLAVKSIASLLRQKAEEESWREILESELWEISHARDEIFTPLQISYARLPTYLKPCFLFCSMFPKDYLISEERLVQLWIYLGYIEPNGRKNPRKVGKNYVKELTQWSFLEIAPNYGEDVYSMHDVVHDFARFNSENGCYSIEAGKVPDLPKEELYHLYVADRAKLVKPLPSDKFSSLLTLVGGGNGVKNLFSTFDFSKVQKLRALELCEIDYEQVFSSLVKLKHLRCLLLNDLRVERLPECICSLYSLQHLTLNGCNFLMKLPESLGNLVSLEELVVKDCPKLRVLPMSFCQLEALTKLVLSECRNLEELPKSIGNLVSLEELVIKECPELRVLPMSLCQLEALTKLELSRCRNLEELPNDMGSLTNLQTLKITNCSVSLPPTDFWKDIKIQTLKLELQCETMGWLKDFVDLKGTLCLHGLENLCLTDVHYVNLRNMHNLECLRLSWDCEQQFSGFEHGLSLEFRSHQHTLPDEQNYFPLMDSLKPHHNLRELYIGAYGGTVFPNWIGNPSSFVLLEQIAIDDCHELTFLPFGNLYKLKYLEISYCSGLQFLRAESLPLGLQELHIRGCNKLISVPGIQKLKSIIKLCIGSCDNLQSLAMLPMEVEPSVELTLRPSESSYQESPWQLRNLASLRVLWIEACYKLLQLEDELLPVETCKVEVFCCPGLKEWCLQHNFTYKDNLDWSW